MGKYEFQGYCFSTEKEMQLAKKEAESVEYVKTKIDFKNYDKSKKMYDALVEKQSFITPIGIGFMKELQEKLKAVSGQVIAPIPAYVPLESKNTGDKNASRNFEHVLEKRKKDREELYRGKLRNSRIISVFLVLIIIAMFVVALLGNNSPFQDAEAKLQDKYAGWQQELEEREQALDAREDALN